jgi:hypothetical protein
MDALLETGSCRGELANIEADAMGKLATAKLTFCVGFGRSPRVP